MPDPERGTGPGLGDELLERGEISAQRLLPPGPNSCRLVHAPGAATFHDPDIEPRRGQGGSKTTAARP
ncbi:hypothetical protein J2W56_004231 [Nocardia kruczakiae]|uniref:Uncharacterized protein n=1 Tax=Nocardia kruczakiae TaxID=261477 RepID=A0ABU1XIW6_9NOCA|nr:hypothetical protein [Nocardia kruczakiae]